MAQPIYRALEGRSDVRAAMKVWHAKFAEGSVPLSGMQGTVDWLPQLGLWGHFGGWKRYENAYRYWNAFGVRTPNFRQNIVVEINPPDMGMTKSMQGVLATAKDGSRWLFHKGRLSIPGKGIIEDEFDVATKGVRLPIEFGDGSVVHCHPVTGIDLPPDVVQQQTAAFVARCRIVRSYYQDGPEVAAENTAVEEAEGSTPELTGSYPIGAQPPRTAVRQHGYVWRSLVGSLNQRKVKHTNDRVGRLGPDLRTTTTPPLLFEIKVSVAAQDLHRAVGQLLVYEHLLGKKHRKVLVLPAVPNEKIQAAAYALGISTLTYKGAGKATSVDEKGLSLLLKGQPFA